MKVVLFCGGLGTRLREHSDTIPKPLVPVGARPILWHVMKYYAHYGHTEFVLCLGYRGDLIRQFFMNYDPRDATDFVMDRGVTKVVSGGSDVADWRIHFVDTGPQSNIGERLSAVRHVVGEDDVFLANYSDQLTDLPLDVYGDWFVRQSAIASFVAVKPSQSFHLAEIDAAGYVQHLRSVQDTETWINGGYMILKREIFEYMEKGDELVEAPFRRLIAKGSLAAYRYSGFWKAMDTLKDKMSFDQMDGQGERPWRIWER